MVLVALGNSDLEAAVVELTAAFPEREFRVVACNLSDGTGAWMKDVISPGCPHSLAVFLDAARCILTKGKSKDRLATTCSE